ncbi:MAG: type II toxin-antitoxin system RelE/ParE family toxin [Candidatus Aegiribacteria sp.]|nr:type II toxin-antitoxin system RelE/ParE family toxin [Candidatus Aegiribacteria sp.]
MNYLIIINTLSVVPCGHEGSRPPQSKKLSGEEKYRLRRGVYRIVYEIQDEKLIVCVVRARHRRNV